MFRSELGCSRRIDVDDVLELHARLANEVAGVDLADATGAEQCHVSHAFSRATSS